MHSQQSRVTTRPSTTSDLFRKCLRRACNLLCFLQNVSCCAASVLTPLAALPCQDHALWPSIPTGCSCASLSCEISCDCDTVAVLNNNFRKINSRLLAHLPRRSVPWRAASEAFAAVCRSLVFRRAASRIWSGRTSRKSAPQTICFNLCDVMRTLCHILSLSRRRRAPFSGHETAPEVDDAEVASVVTQVRWI